MRNLTYGFSSRRARNESVARAALPEENYTNQVLFGQCVGSFDHPFELRFTL